MCRGKQEPVYATGSLLSSALGAHHLQGMWEGVGRALEGALVCECGLSLHAEEQDGEQHQEER